jgi:2-hydroxy-3-keto-5-methylthiopentenyl-1-phosphate phosphatase
LSLASAFFGTNIGFTVIYSIPHTRYFGNLNLFNMFKLLDNKWRTSIIDELQEHIGKGSNSKDVTNRNIYEGTEIEFLVVENSISKLITGVVLETNYEDSIYRVDSYENKYDVDLEDITKILNNTKYKYNLNKLDHIDFL